MKVTQTREDGTYKSMIRKILQEKMGKQIYISAVY
jgi:hypothetical protein